MNIEFGVALGPHHDSKKGLKLIESAYIEHIYQASKYNQSKCARMLDISRGCLRMKLKEYFEDKYL